MVYEINPVTTSDGFKPFSVTLTFETEEEYVNFHDNVMGKITTGGVHDFHGAIYNAGSEGIVDGVKGKI